MFPTILLAFGFVNGIILGGILMNLKNANPLATKLFAWIAILFALSIGQELIEILGLHHQFPHILSSTDGFILLIYPLLYLYALIIMGKKRKLVRKDLFHALPFLVFTIHLIPYYTLSGYEKLNFQHSINFALLAYLKAIPIIIYLILITRLCLKSSSNNKRAPNNNNVNILWFKIFIFLMIALGIFSLILCTFENYGYRLSFDSDTISSSLLSVIIYSYSFLLIKKPFMLLGITRFPLNTKQIMASSPIRYRNSPLSFEAQNKYLDKIKQVMAIKKLYLNPNLSPIQLAEIANLKPHYLSQIFNQVLNKNFYTFVNEYRVEEVKRLMNDSNQYFKTLLALSLESGFNSKSSFNRIFKEYTGLTPSQYKKQIQSK